MEAQPCLYTWTPRRSSTAAFFPLLNHRGGKVLTQPDSRAGRQDRHHHGLEDGGQQRHHGERGRVHPVLQGVGLVGGLVVVRGGRQVSWD